MSAGRLSARRRLHLRRGALPDDDERRCSCIAATAAGASARPAPSFALNAMIEADRVELTRGEPEIVLHAVEQRQGPEDIARCPTLPHRRLEPLRRRRATRCASCAWARSTSPTGFRRTSTSSRDQAAVGGAAAGHACVAEYYDAKVYGPPRVSSVARHCGPQCTASLRRPTSASAPFVTNVSSRCTMDTARNPPYTCLRVRRRDLPEASVHSKKDLGSGVVSGSTARRCAGAGDRFCIGQRCSTNTMGEDG